MPQQWPPSLRFPVQAACLLVALAALASCGGGGGGGGGSGGGGSSAAGSVKFTGFSFRTSAGEAFEAPPFENLDQIPPTLGAALDTVVVFHFDGVPAGPFNLGTLPVYTTPAEVTSAAGAPSTALTIPAKGSYALVVDEAADLYSVEFRPFVPTAPLQIALSSDSQAVPGLLPGSIYTALVNTSVGSSIGNLSGPGGSIQFETTSNTAAYYPKDVAADDPPMLLASTPSDGEVGFFPNIFSMSPLDSTTPTFPEGPSDFLLTYDRSLEPSVENLFGKDLNGDGISEPVFFARARATEFLVGHQVLAGTFGPHDGFAALSGLEPGVGSPLDGSEVIWQQDAVLPGGETPGWLRRPTAMASAEDADLLYVVFARPGNTDLISIGDHLLGDPTHGQLATSSLGGNTVALDTGLQELVGLEVLSDGRLVGFDQDLGRVVEIAVSFMRQRPTPDKPSLDPPVILGVETAADAGSDLFLSDVWPAGVEVLDLASAPSGAIRALVRLAPGESPAIVDVSPIDPDLNGSYAAGEGTFSGAGSDVLLQLNTEIAAIEFLSEEEVLALDRSTDQLLSISLADGSETVVTTDVAAFGFPLAVFPDGLSPATTLALGTMDIDLEVQLQSNSDSGAVVQLTPQGVLPIGVELTLMQRNTLTSLFGTSLLNADPGIVVQPTGATELLRVTTATPTAGIQSPIDDVFLEDFADDAYEDDQPLSTSPLAEWANGSVGLGGGLRASVGVSSTAALGDFRPLAESGFKFNQAWIRSDPPWVGVHDPDDHPEYALDMTKAGYAVILLNTDAQSFPLPNGATPGVTTPTTVFGGEFSFRDFIIPEGVRVVVRGSNPLRITASGRVEIHGMLDVRGTDGLADDTFDSAFLPVPGGPGGPGAGRGGDAHPTLFDPAGTGAIDQFVTPEEAERGFGPSVDQFGRVTFVKNGGFGGVSTVGYDVNAQGFPKGLITQPAGPAPNSEHHRPPGGGGGTFYHVGRQAHEGSGVYLVQSSSTWFPFTKCPFDDKVNDSLYGNDENVAAGIPGAQHTQCVYIVGSPEDPERFKPGGLPGDLVFKDADPENDFIGPGGELEVLIGGQGGGGGGTRVDSWRHSLWAFDPLGNPFPSPPAPPFYPVLAGGVFFPPSLFDAKGGAGGGGGGGVRIRSFGDILIGKTGHIDARGGHGGGGEVVQNSNIGGGGGGGSGGAVLLQAAGQVILDADQGNRQASYTDPSGRDGASVEVSGGFGRESQTDTPSQNYDFERYSYDYTRSDGGQGGFGLIQLQSGAGEDGVDVRDGAFAFAKLRLVQKQGPWTGDAGAQGEHPDSPGGDGFIDDLRYVDMLHYRYFRPDPAESVDDYYITLNGSYPPLVKSDDGINEVWLTNEYPAGSGQFWGDTKMMANEWSGGVPVVQEIKPEAVMKTYAGFDPVTFEENNVGPGGVPGSTWGPAEVIPLAIEVMEPGGTPFMVEQEGQSQFDPAHLVDRLPVIPLDRTPPPIGTNSHGISVWLDFGGSGLRMRSDVASLQGRTPPFFEPFLGTHNAGEVDASTQESQAGKVRLGADVPPENTPARYVLLAGAEDPGLFPGPAVGTGTPPNPPRNDVKVDAPDLGGGFEDAVTNNASVSVLFQGAYAVRPGSHVPDAATMTEWVPDLTALSGYPLVRFQVLFDLGVDPVGLPFGVDSYRPLVDYVRLRTSY